LGEKEFSENVRYKMKKAQTEMMGLVILVLIITVAAVFGIRFLFSEKEEVSAGIKLATQAANLRNSLLKMTISDKSLSDLAVDCCLANNCDFLRNELPKIVEQVIPNQEYEIELTDNSNSKKCFKTSQYTCKNRVSDSGRIERETGSYNFMVSLCLP